MHGMKHFKDTPLRLQDVNLLLPNLTQNNLNVEVRCMEMSAYRQLIFSLPMTTSDPHNTTHGKEHLLLKHNTAITVLNRRLELNKTTRTCGII